MCRSTIDDHIMDISSSQTREHSERYYPNLTTTVVWRFDRSKRNTLDQWTMEGGAGPRRAYVRNFTPGRSGKGTAGRGDGTASRRRVSRRAVISRCPWRALQIACTHTVCRNGSLGEHRDVVRSRDACCKFSSVQRQGPTWLCAVRHTICAGRNVNKCLLNEMKKRGYHIDDRIDV